MATLLTRPQPSQAADAGSGSVVVRPATEADIPAVLAFASACYGPHSSQASRTRMDWLLRANPYSQGLGADLLLAVLGQNVVGCHWKMRLPWIVSEERTIVPSPHDLSLLQPYREATGSKATVPPGLQLALGVLNRERNAALLGLSPASESIYSRFQCQPVPMVRMQKILSYTRVATGMARDRLRLSQRLPSLRGELNWMGHGRLIRLTRGPDDIHLQEALLHSYRGGTHPAWDVPTYRWRFFHPLGPRHFLLTLAETGECTARAVFSLGFRHGAVMARLVDAAVAVPSLYPVVLDAAEEAMRRLGVAVATAATTCVAAHTHLAQRGWKVQHGVASRFHTRPVRTLDFSDLWGGAYDYGFDAASAS